MGIEILLDNNPADANWKTKKMRNEDKIVRSHMNSYKLDIVFKHEMHSEIL